jgi:hypothetical protein
MKCYPEILPKAKKKKKKKKTHHIPQSSDEQIFHASNLYRVESSQYAKSGPLKTLQHHRENAERKNGRRAYSITRHLTYISN